MFIKEGKKNPRQPHMWNLYALPCDAVQVYIFINIVFQPRLYCLAHSLRYINLYIHKFITNKSTLYDNI